MTWVALLALLAYLGFVFAAASILHLQGPTRVIFSIVMSTVGILAAVFFLLYQKKLLGRPVTAASEDGAARVHDLTALLRDADRKLRGSSRAGAKSLASLPLLYIVGEANSAKTRTILQSGLDPELLAGHLFSGQAVAPTSLVNVWFAGRVGLIEAGDAVVREERLWQQLIRSTQRSRVRGIFASKSSPRAAVICISCELLLSAKPEELEHDVRFLNDRLRKMAAAIGVALPIYVLFTKLDLVPGFAEYVRNLTPQEVSDPLGSVLPRVQASAGLYAEEATSTLNSALDPFFNSLSEYRFELLSREGTEPELSRLYEFTRQLSRSDKLRPVLKNFLLELVRPSHLSANPYLRGFFFTGQRRHTVNDVFSTSVAPTPSPSATEDNSATRVFSFNAPSQATAIAPARSRSAHEILEWVFLPHLFPKVILQDRSALQASTSTSRSNLGRRIALGLIALIPAVLLVLLTTSYFHNSQLQRQILSSEATLTESSSNLTSLTALDNLRQSLMLLDRYRIAGPPLSWRGGLYRGDAIYPSTCQQYRAGFKKLLLSPAQSSILVTLSQVLTLPAEDADYNSVYAPLKAYLITTSHPEKSTVDFLLPELLKAWTRQQTSASQAELQLASQQFRYYAAARQQGTSCLAAPDTSSPPAEISKARSYLRSFDPYRIMVAAANRNFAPIDFNHRQYPGTSSYVTVPHTVPGAFTKAGYEFMQNAIAHPETYFRDEDWVLGTGAEPPPDLSTLKTKYNTEYSQQWRTLLSSASVVGFRALQDAQSNLSVLTSNTSPLLELLSLISQNTSVPEKSIAKAFQPPQYVVPPSNVEHYIGDSNQKYVDALERLQQAIQVYAQMPLAATNPEGTNGIVEAAAAADIEARSLGTKFATDTQGVDKATLKRLEEPISSVQALVREGPTNAINKAGAAFCAQFGALSSLFPFNADSSQDAAFGQVQQIFQPSSGALWQFYNSTIKQVLVLQGTEYVPTPNSSIHVNPAFRRFFNHSVQISNTLYPNGASQPSLTFTVREAQASGTAGAALEVNGETLNADSGQKQFSWNPQNPGTISLSASNYPSVPFSGSWAPYHFVKRGSPEINSGGLMLTFPLSFAGVPGNAVHFEVTPVSLNPEYLGSGLHCVAKIAE